MFASLLQQFPQMRYGAPGLFNGAALDGEDDVSFGSAANPKHPRPVDHAVTAGTADRSASDLAAFGRGLIDGDVLGVEMNAEMARCCGMGRTRLPITAGRL